MKYNAPRIPPGPARLAMRIETTSPPQRVSTGYSRQELWSLFLMCAFPLHLWTLILGFRDLSWLAERTDAWDAVGVLSYGLIFALAESLLFFLAVLLLGLLVSRRWGSDRRTALLFLLIFLLSLWAVLSQLFFLSHASVPGPLIALLAPLDHPVRILYLLAALVVTPTIILPVLLVLRSDRSLPFLRLVMERLSVLSAFYLFFDVVALVIVLVRNLA